MAEDSSASPVAQSSTLSSPANKSVSFAASHQVAPAVPITATNTSSSEAEAEADSSSPSPPAAISPVPRPPPMKRRRSSLKQGIQMPNLPPKEQYQHSDPLLRRLRLRDSHGAPVDLQREFRDAKIVLFMFGASWRGSSQDPYQAVERFAKRQPHRIKVIFVSVDESKQSYNHTTRGRSWLSMEWNDGSNDLTGSGGATGRGEDSDDNGNVEPEEPFLLAGDDDLEEETSINDSTGTLYLRPFSRVFLAEKFQILSVPNLAVYHLGKREMLSTHARLDLLSPGRTDDTLERWERGEKIHLSLGDIATQMRWTLTFAAVGVSYLAAVHLGGAPNYVLSLSEKLTRQMLSRQ